MRRWARREGIGRRLVISGLVLALLVGVIVSLITSPLAISSEFSTVGYNTHYGSQPQKTYVTTVLSGGGHSGTAILVAPGTYASDLATLSGSNAFKATGTVTYTVFSDRHCDRWAAIANGGTVWVTSGRVRNSNRVTLYASGTYYWQATYSGDRDNTSSTSSCGSEIETVKNAFKRR